MLPANTTTQNFRHRALISTSQLPVDRWYELVGNPTLVDAILDRIVQDAYRVELSGESLRKPRASA
jgi:DNA replication protein DnaC